MLDWRGRWRNRSWPSRGNISTPVWDMKLLLTAASIPGGLVDVWNGHLLKTPPCSLPISVKSIIHKQKLPWKKPTFWTVKEDILRRYYVTAQHVVSLPSCSAAAKQMATIRVTKPVECHFWAESQIVEVSSFTYAEAQYKSCLAYML
jgi:hypothetical protein